MNLEILKKQVVKFDRARKNLLAVVVFTLVNLFLYALGIDLSFLFTAFVPQLLAMFVDAIFGIVPAMLIGIFATSIYLLWYFLAKRWRGFILAALIFFIFDGIIMLLITFLSGSFSNFIFDIAFHAWVLFYLINGTVAWARLGKATPEMIAALRESANQEQEAKELTGALNNLAPETPTGALNNLAPEVPAKALSNPVPETPVETCSSDLVAADVTKTALPNNEELLPPLDQIKK